MEIPTFDSLHIATAEAAQASVMLTTDDKFGKNGCKVRIEHKSYESVKVCMGGDINVKC